MKKNGKTAIIFFAILFCFSTNYLEAKQLKRAIDFELSDIYNNKLTLNIYKNEQPVLLFFWTTWCPYCRKELRVLNEKYPELSEQGFEVIAINIEESAARVANYVKSQGIKFKVLLDKDAKVASAYHIIGVPTYIVIDKEGYIESIGNSFPENYTGFTAK